MNYTKEEVMSIVADVLGDCPVGVFVNYAYISGDGFPEVRSSIDVNFSVESTSKFIVSMGASKLCIIPRNTHKDWVIKIPYTGIFGNDEEGNCSIIAEALNDYICDEIDIYENVSPLTRSFLAKNVFVGLYNGIPIYVQERAANVFYGCSHSYSYDPIVNHSYAIELLKCYDSMGHMTAGYVSDILLTYGYTFTTKIFDEVEAWCADLHDENFGYTKTGRPILIDYGGYSVSESWHWLKEGEKIS